MKRWKSTAREATASLVGFLPVFVIIGRELGWDDGGIPLLAGLLALATAVSTALMSPAGKEWSKEHLHEEEYIGKRRKKD